MIAPLVLAAMVVAASIAAALIALLILYALTRRREPKPNLASFDSPLEQAIFLFEDHDLIDATNTARSLLRSIPGKGSEWDRLCSYLSPRFEGFETRISALADEAELNMQSKSDADLRLRAEWLGHHARLTLIDMSAEGQGVLIDGLSQRAQEEELLSLRETLGAAPILVWRLDNQGGVVWANHAYLNCVMDMKGLTEDELTWPIPALFGQVATGSIDHKRRQKLQSDDEGKCHWFELHHFPSGEGSLNFALPADKEVRAETSLRDFVQTLTKTFAHLPIGLAIFDRQRQLALFNPALVDLTTISAEFLSTRPTLFAFLDRLREARIIPEPKDYRSWRQKMVELEHAAASGLFEESWNLASGQTFRVSGRPHPDGAVAFLIEDISAEVTLTRHFRSEIELGQAVVDTIAEAIAVFSPAGELVMTNAAYETLWQVDTAATLSTISATESTRIWQHAALPSPVFGEIRDFVGAIDERAEWTADLKLLSGASLTVRCAPLPGGATLVGFERLPCERTAVRRLRRSRKSTEGVSAAEHIQA
ncbi:MAG: PAS-domain containing protein [Albidovulum sp.]